MAWDSAFARLRCSPGVTEISQPLFRVMPGRASMRLGRPMHDLLPVQLLLFRVASFVNNRPRTACHACCAASRPHVQAVCPGFPGFRVSPTHPHHVHCTISLPADVDIHRCAYLPRVWHPFSSAAMDIHGIGAQPSAASSSNSRCLECLPRVPITLHPRCHLSIHSKCRRCSLLVAGVSAQPRYLYAAPITPGTAHV